MARPRPAMREPCLSGEPGPTWSGPESTARESEEPRWDGPPDQPAASKCISEATSMMIVILAPPAC